MEFVLLKQDSQKITSYESMINLARHYQRQGKHKKYLQYLKLAQNYHDTNITDKQDYCSLCPAKTKQPLSPHGESEKYFANESDKKKTRKIEEFFLLYTKLKNYSKILENYHRYQSLLSPLSIYLVGNAYFKMNKYSGALKTWEKALHFNDESLSFIRHRVEQLRSIPNVITGENLLYPKEPQVHILILTMNRKPYLKKTIQCLGKTDYDNYKVFLLDNCSTDGTKEILPDLDKYLPKHTEYTFESLPTNIGRPGGHNWLLKNWDHSDADYIAILDDDLLHFEPNWLKIFLNTFTLSPKLAAVGSKTLTPEGNIQDAFPVLTGIENGTNVTFFTHRNEMDIGQHDFLNNIPDYVTGCASLFKKEVFHTVGLFDIRFSPSQYVDIDHGLRMRKAGYDLMYNGNASVIHAQLTHYERKQSRASQGNQRGNSYKLSQKYDPKFFYDIIRNRKIRESQFYSSHIIS